MARLPVPGGDSANWGTILNDFLSQSLSGDGSLKPNSVGASQIQTGVVSETMLASGVQTKLNSGGGTPITKSDIGLENVDNTSDATKNSATVTLTNKTISGASNTLSNIGISSLLATGTASSSTFLRGDGAWASPTGGSSTEIGVQWVAAPTGVASTDTAAIQAAHDALLSTGGDIMLQGGTYAISATGVTFTKRVRLLGVGNWGGIDWPYTATFLYCNSISCRAITVTSEAFAMENIFMANDGGVIPTSGYGIQCTNTRAYLNNVNIFNFYDNVRMADNCAQWSITNSQLNAPARYSLYCANPTNPDAGDNTVDNTQFIPTGGQTTAPVAAIRWESGGGLRVTNSKINGAFGVSQFLTGIDVAVASSAVTSDIFINNNSIENVVTTGIKLSQQSSGSGSVSLIQIQGNQFQGTTSTLIDFGQGFGDGVISGNVGNGDNSSTVGIRLRASCGSTFIGGNHWATGVFAPLIIDSGAGATNLPATLTTAQATSGTGQTQILSYTIPTHSLVTGATFKIHAIGTQSASTANLTFQIHAGTGNTTSDTVITSTTPSVGSSGSASFEGVLTIRSTGGSGTTIAEGVGNGTSTTVSTTSGTSTINTTTTNYITLSVAASAGTFTVQTAVIMQI